MAYRSKRFFRRSQEFKGCGINPEAPLAINFKIKKGDNSYQQKNNESIDFIYNQPPEKMNEKA